MSSNPESSSDLWLEHSNFIGCALGAIAYGFFVTLFFITVYYISQNSTKGGCRAITLGYIFVLFVVTTVNVAVVTRWNMLTFIDNRNYPGGPIAYGYLETAELIVGNAMYIVSNILTDGLVLYRCLIIWQDNYFVMAGPLLMFLASIALSIIFVYQTAQPGANLWTTLTVDFAVPYWSLSISLNIIVTFLISGRLLMMRKHMREALGDNHARKYTSAIAMLVESAALYSGTSLLFLIAYARKSYVQNLIWPILTSVMPAASFLILLRVASGNGFSRETTTYSLGELTKLSFVIGPNVAPEPQFISVRNTTGDLTRTSDDDNSSRRTSIARGMDCC